MYQNVYSYTESRMQELSSNSNQPAASATSMGEQLRQDAATALISLGNWIKPRSASGAVQGRIAFRRAGLAGR